MPGRAPRAKARTPITFLLPLVLAASLGGVLYLVISSLPYLAGTGSTDLTFGPLNECLQRALPTGRSGFVLSTDGQKLAAWAPASLVVCRLDGAADGGAVATTTPLEGVGAAAFDFEGGLWLAQKEHLYFVDAASPSQPLPLGEVAPVALTGTQHGVVALEASGRVLAMRRDGSVDGLAQLPRAPGQSVFLTTSADGTRVALAAGGGVFVWNAEHLEPLRAEAPCPVEFLWWKTSGHTAVVQCGPKGSWALEYDVESGATAPAKVPPSQSVLVPGLKLYVQPCESLACTATAP